MSDERYSPSVKVDHALTFIHITSLLQLGRVTEAWAAFQAAAIPMGDFGGALDAGLPHEQIIEITNRDFNAAPGFVYAYRFHGPAQVSPRVPDGRQVFIGVSAKAGDFPATTSSYGNGTALVTIGAGEWYANVKLGKDMTACPANIWIGSPSEIPSK